MTEPLWEPDLAEPGASLDQTVPNNPEAEAAALGSMLVSLKAVEQVSQTLADAQDFHQPRHQIIYRAITDIHGRTRTPKIDPITVAAELLATGELAKVGGANYLHHLVNTVPIAGNADSYAEIIRETAQLRAVLTATRLAGQRVLTAAATASEILEAAMADLQAASQGVQPADVRMSVADRWMGFIDELEAGHDPRALDTPWYDLNHILELKPGQMITVGAGTGQGKSLLGMNLAAHVALTRGKPALVASLEMGGSELMARLTAAEAGVNVDRLIRRNLEPTDWEKVFKAAPKLQNAHNFILDDSPNLTVARIRTRLRWMAAQGHPAAICVADYLQLVTPEPGKKERTRANEVAEISRSLKLLAMEFEIPVVALAQFNRNAVGRQPMVSDFKDSSSIEQDSNVIILMHRPLAEDGSDTGPRAGEIDLIIAKNRNGASGRVVPLSFQGHFARLRSMGRA
ncbi:replicative DNA helicase [Streptomyces scabiei]|uniref:replicative DNA helicase n=1 Tax=Streptomyces scabiei TaxID=1930 RepID=UPI0029ABD5E3|nr:DnaB-like helicase C-terminal domain-containing protein [Streptomyces scabiei]MDX3035220.1 DnaB-like helicase C-terminal domain-containing protein [Streptomyces scabiei]